MIPISAYLVLSAAMFIIGLIGFVVRRNAIVAFMCIELMLNAVNITFAALSGAAPCAAEACREARMDGQIAVFFVMVVAAAEAAVGLAVVIAVFRNRQSLDTDRAAELKG